MSSNPRRRHAGTWRPWAVASAATLGALAAPAALAAEPATASPQGLMVFPHARVERLSAKAVQALRASEAQAAAPAMRAYLDPATGRLVQPTAEQAAALEAAAARQGTLQTRRKVAPQRIYPAQGGEGLRLDDSQAPHSVARVHQGQVETLCVEDGHSAHAAVHSVQPAAARAGHHGHAHSRTVGRVQTQHGELK